MTQMIDAGQNPALANDLIASAVADTPAAVEVVGPPPIAPPPDTRVTLLAGLIDPLQGTSATDAVVRELTGADEEVLASPAVARSVSKFVQAVTGRGTETIGGRKPSPADFDGLLIGDRELLLFAIRKATYGPDMELVTICPHCEDREEGYIFDLNSVETRPLERLEDAIYGFDVPLPSGRVARVSLPRAVDQDALLTAEKKNIAELDTLMLTRCVTKLDNEMIGAAALRELSVRDRREVLKQINDRTPGPRLGEAKRTCRACDKEFDLGLGLLDIFRA